MQCVAFHLACLSLHSGLLECLLQECQNKDWALHKPECAAIQRWAAAAPAPELAIPSDAIRCLGRVLWAWQKKGQESQLVSSQFSGSLVKKLTVIAGEGVERATIS